MAPLSSTLAASKPIAVAPVGSGDAETNRAAAKVKPDYRPEWLWNYVIGFALLHAGAVYGAYAVLCGRVLAKTLVCATVVFACTGLGTTAGVHRLWSHRAYSARLPVRALLALFQMMGYQHNIFKWVRDHRVHHKYTDTDADPHNSSRGFFFSHIGWLLMRPHPDVHTRCLQVDMSDVLADPVVRWQRRYFAWLAPLVAFVLTPLIPYILWNESYYYSFFVVGLLRHALWLHCTFLINSAAHIYGTRPYEKNISPTENAAVGLLAFGEGWHNYHHTFPWDYKAAELGNYRLNFATAFIDACAFFGLTYNLKTADPGLVAKRGTRTGDGTKSFVADVGTEVDGTAEVTGTRDGTAEITGSNNGTAEGKGQVMELRSTWTASLLKRPRNETRKALS